MPDVLREIVPDVGAKMRESVKAMGFSVEVLEFEHACLTKRCGLSHADLVILSGQSGPSFTVGHWVKSCRLGYLVRTKWSFIHCGALG